MKTAILIFESLLANMRLYIQRSLVVCLSVSHYFLLVWVFLFFLFYGGVGAQKSPCLTTGALLFFFVHNLSISLNMYIFLQIWYGLTSIISSENLKMTWKLLHGIRLHRSKTGTRRWLLVGVAMCSASCCCCWRQSHFQPQMATKWRNSTTQF